MSTKYFFSYAIIGLAAAAIDIIFFWLFFEILLFGIFISNAISVGSAASFSFYMNAVHNFKKSNYLFYRLISFISIVIIGYFTGIFLILFLINELESQATIAKLLSLPIVFALQYFLNSVISFR
jgi:putative flippase GtrA